MKKLILLFIFFLISCQSEIENEQQIIAYYAGDEKSIDEFINHLEKRVEEEDFRNSVEKITFLTTLHVIKKNIGEK